MINPKSYKEITITPGRYKKIFSICAVIVVSLHLLFLPLDFTYSLDIAQFFSVRYERNLPTFFSSLNLLIGAILGICLFAQSKGSREKRFWAVAAVALLIMGYDEAAQIHEFYGQKIHSIIFNGEPGLFASKWLQIYIPIITAGCLYFFFEAKSLPSYKYSLIFPVFLFLSGSVGVEFINYYFSFTGGPAGIFLETVEEVFEIASIVLLNHELLVIMSRRPNPVKIIITE